MASKGGKHKAALLLTSLDPATAAELLKGQSPEMIQELAMELSHIDASGEAGKESAIETAKDFCATLQRSAVGNLHIKSFVDTVLKGAAGKEKADEFKTQMKKALTDKDPYIAIGSASAPQIVAALQDEPPQAIALVLTNLPPKLGTEIIARLDEETANKTVWRMTKPGDISAKIVHRIGEMICKKLVELTSDEGIPFEETLPKETLRKVAIVLSGLAKDKRDVLMESIQGNDQNIADTVKALMVAWEDIIKIEDRSLQESLRKVDAGVLAKALFGADLIIAQKIRSNISERASEMVDEETALMSEPRKKEIIEAREKVVKPLREANETEELKFIEDD